MDKEHKSMKPYAKKFYRSKEWLRCRQSYIASKYGLCERCADVGKIVHHKRYITPENIHDPSITLNHANLELLCATCHQHEHYKKDSAIAEGLVFDSNGDLVRG